LASLPARLIGRADAKGAELAQALSVAIGGGGRAAPPLVA
jgi:hypothetical protein